MLFKTERVAAEWASPLLNRLLREVMEAAADYALYAQNWVLFITSIHRTPEENDALYGGHGTHLVGVHTVWRAADIRTRDVDPSAVNALTTFINDRYQYDPERPGFKVALPEGEGFGSSASHLHVQVCTSTVLSSPALAKELETA